MNKQINVRREASTRLWVVVLRGLESWVVMLITSTNDGPWEKFAPLFRSLFGKLCELILLLLKYRGGGDRL